MSSKQSAPGQSNLPFALVNDGRKFAITDTYVRNPTAKGVEALLRVAQISEDIKVVGNVNIISVVEATKDVLCCQYTEEFDRLAVGYTDGVVRLFKTSTMECVQSLQDAEIVNNPSPVTGIKHRAVTKNSPVTNCVTCSYANGCVKCWNYDTVQCMYTIREKRQTLGLTYHPRLPKFVTYGDDNKIFLYDEATKTQERILSSSDNPSGIDGHNSRVFSCCFNPRSNHEFVSGGWDDTVHFWDLRQSHALRHFSGVHMCGEGIDINAKGTEILTCAWQKENALRLWDYASGNVIVTMEPDVHESMLYCGKYVTKDFFVCGGSEPHIFRLIDLRQYTTTASMTGFSGGVYAIDIGPAKKSKKSDAAKSDLRSPAMLPRMAFCCGKKVYQIEFS